ncbi:MAG: RimK family alpha-L-glutamate ligase [Patescibacteria group bacterium]|nr:RimK family alpha-L-glutamate ligase [Patescibacteria group bacterium]
MRLLIIANPETAECERLSEETDRLGHDMRAFPVRDLSFETDGSVHVLTDGENVLESFDAVYIRNIFPFISEGLLLAEMMHAVGKRVIDRCLATENYVQSKTYNAWKLERVGVNTPRGFQAANEDEVHARLRDADFPVVVKGVHGSQGAYVHKCPDERAVLEVMRAEPEMPHLVQEYLDIEHEYRVLTIGFRAIGAIEKHAAPGDFRRNLSLGGSATPAELPDGLMTMCEKASETLGYEFAGADLAILKDGRPVMLEVNRAPGFCGFERATGDNVAGRFIEYMTSVNNV